MNDNNDPGLPGSTDIDRHIGRRIRQAFTDAGINDDAAAGMLGISIAALGELFEGRFRCAPIALMMIAEATEKSISWFFTSEGATE